jgi:putative oxygen-independent coproporphyrinogen III oxidase
MVLPALPILTEPASPAPSPALDRQALPAADVPGLYVHVPFCFHKCHYCDFYSLAHQPPQRMRRYVDLLLKEAEQWTAAAPVRLRPRTVFFGGGTPTLLPPPQMHRLIAGLRKRFDFSCCGEWTVEANPATVTPEYCQMLREQGVDRLSFGAQSFDRAELALLQRHHDPDDVQQSVAAARGAGFARLNLDLIYAICGQSLESWSRSLEQALAIGTEHLSCYGLTYEPNTPLAVQKRLGRVKAVEEQVELAMLGHARRRLAAAGLAAYEISNYSRPGGQCRHNLLYWAGGDYIGLGPSAASHVQGWRWKNRPHLGDWERAIDAGHLPAGDVEHLSPRRRAGELAILSLRLSRGLIYSEFSQRLGLDARALFADCVDRFSRMGLLEADDTGVRLSPRGLAVADSLAAEFILE